METVTEKLRKLSRDLYNARLESRQAPRFGEYLGVGATIRVPSERGIRLLGVYGRDVADGVALDFFEDGRKLTAIRSVYRVAHDGVRVEREAPSLESMRLLQRSREFWRPDLSMTKNIVKGTVPRNEVVFIDDMLRHAISQAASFRRLKNEQRIEIFAQDGVRLPVREFNKRLPDHSNALRMWLEFRDLTLPPEMMMLLSGLPYRIHKITGGEYEGGVAVSIAGNLNALTDPRLYPEGPLLRMHSACSFSEKGRRKGYIGNLEHDAAYCQMLAPGERPFVPFVERPTDTCDCRLQMEESQRRIAVEGGIFADFYEQEGRGYGLLNKEEFFYRLFEEEGWDTAEVCERYGINPDIRTYDGFVAWLLSLGIRRVRLLGNNPRKRHALEKAGIKVTPVGLWLPTEGNIAYLQTKRDRLDHDIPDDEELFQRLIDLDKFDRRLAW